jgi:hypothetical protein
VRAAEFARCRKVEELSYGARQEKCNCTGCANNWCIFDALEVSRGFSKMHGAEGSYSIFDALERMLRDRGRWKVQIEHKELAGRRPAPLKCDGPKSQQDYASACIAAWP